MKKLISILLFVPCSLCVQAQQYHWVDISGNIPAQADLSDLYFIDDRTGWISSSNMPIIFKTTDGGQSFTASIDDPVLPSSAIHMVSQTDGYCGGNSGFIYKTSDGGTNWSFLGVITNNLTDLTFPPPGGTGYACGANGTIYSVTSSGVSAMTSGVPNNLESICFPVDSSEGWICGGSVIRHYNNGNWVADQFKPSGDYNAIFFTDNQNGWAVGDRIIHTTDGQNWTEQTNPDTVGRAMLDAFFLNENEGWIVGNQGLILHTINGGMEWIIQADGLTTSLLTGVHFTSSTNGYITGNNKTFLKYTHLTSVSEMKRTIDFELFPNYPNPFNPTTMISYQLKCNSYVELALYNILGEKLMTLVNEYQMAGNHKVELNLSHLPSGTYFYSLSADKFIETKKMVLLK